MVFRETFFANPPASSSSLYPGGFNPWISNATEDTSPHVTSERQNPAGPSARNSCDPSEGRFSKDYGADQQRLQISELHFDKFPNPATFACWKMRSKLRCVLVHNFLRKVCCGSKKWRWLIQWMISNLRVLSEELLVQTLSCSTREALNKIIQNTRFKKKVSLEEMKAHKEDRFVRGRRIAGKCYEYFRDTGANDSVENYADLFTIGHRNDDIQEFDSKWDEILLSMTQIPSDDILESLYKLRKRVSEKLKTVLELYNMEVNKKKAGPDYHRLKTMVRRSIEQHLRMKNFEARNGNYATSAVVTQRERRSLRDCWQWEANGQCSKGDSCSFRHDMNKRAKSTQPNPREMHREPEVPEEKVPVVECLDGHARITSNELAPIHSVKSGILQNACSTSPKKGCTFGEKCSYAHRQVDEQPTERFFFKKW